MSHEPHPGGRPPEDDDRCTDQHPVGEHHCFDAIAGWSGPVVVTSTKAELRAVTGQGDVSWRG